MQDFNIRLEIFIHRFKKRLLVLEYKFEILANKIF